MTKITDNRDNLIHRKEDNTSQPFNDYLKDKVDQRIEICQKRLREAEQKRDLTEYVRMEAKIDAYSDIWSFLENKDNVTTPPKSVHLENEDNTIALPKLEGLEENLSVLKSTEEALEQMRLQTNGIIKLHLKNAKQ